MTRRAAACSGHINNTSLPPQDVQPPPKSSDLVAIESRLWAAADQLWANTGLKPSEFSTPVLGLIFLRCADKRFSECAQILHAKGIPADEREPMDYQAEGVLYVSGEARLSHLLTLIEGSNLGRAIATAMALV